MEFEFGGRWDLGSGSRLSGVGECDLVRLKMQQC